MIKLIIKESDGECREVEVVEGIPLAMIAQAYLGAKLIGVVKETI